MALQINKILCPTDFSDLSVRALNYAKGLTETFNAQLHCLHVIDEGLATSWSVLGPESVPVGPAVDDLQSLAEGQMQRFADEHLIGLKYTPLTKVVMGRPFVGIVAYAREHSIDLIVIGTHGRSGLTHALLGSTAERVVRKAPCPVLTVRDLDRAVTAP